MKLREHGYTEKSYKNYEMTMSDLVLTIAQGLIKKNRTDMKIRLVDTFMGEVEDFENLNDLLTHDWNATWRVNVFETTCMHDNRNDFDYLKVVFADDVEMMD